MDAMTCPQCQGTMEIRSYGHADVARCVDCSGIFLTRADLGALVEAETDWHAHQLANTAALPRITSQMSSPPPLPERSRAFVEALFRA